MARCSPAAPREPRADFEEPHVPLLAMAVVRHSVHESGQPRRPKDAEVLRQRVGDGHQLVVAGKRRCRRPGDESERLASENPAPVMTERSCRARVIRGSILAVGSRSAGKRPGILSKPLCRAISSIRSTSRATSTRRAGTLTDQPSGAADKGDAHLQVWFDVDDMDAAIAKVADALHARPGGAGRFRTQRLRACCRPFGRRNSIREAWDEVGAAVRNRASRCRKSPERLSAFTQDDLPSGRLDRTS